MDLSELGMEDYSLIYQYNLNFAANDLSTTVQGAGGDSYMNLLINNTKNCTETSKTKQFKTSSSWNSSTTTGHLSPKHSNSSSSCQFLSFDRPKTESKETNLSGSDQRGTKRPYAMTRTPTHAQDHHVMAERKRREKLSERFIALSAMVPNLKKMDKASVLGEAVKYMKQLQERLQVLEEQTKKKTVESVVFVKKSQLISGEDDESSSDENFDGRFEEAVPEIEARVSDKDVLIRINCNKKKSVAPKIISNIETSLNLSVQSSNVLLFGNSTLDITIVAQMDNEFNMTVKDLVKNLRLALLKFM